MTAELFSNPALTVALALATGMLAQVVARHLSIPGIVVLLAVGVVLGPAVLGVVQPDTLGRALLTLVGFAVSVVLFEGGMNLDIGRLRHQERSIRSLISVGALVTTIGGTLAARFILGWDWRPSVLFGTLVIVTGPTVITPLLKRVKVQRSVATVLEAEGVFGDAVGAVVAVVALEAALSPMGAATLAESVLHVLGRLGVGALIGLVGGLVIALLLRYRDVIPEGLENVSTLAMALAIYQVSNAVLHESGIAAAIVAGMVVGNSPSHVTKQLHEFKEQLTVMLIGMLFVLLAADVDLNVLRGLGARGLITVGVLMFVVRPAAVFLSTWGAPLAKKQKLFIAWLGPRGIVAAAVASLFASELERAGVAGGELLREMVFMVIAITVGFAGITGGVVAKLLEVARPKDTGWVLLGANALSRELAKALTELGQEVVCIDANPDAARRAEEQGLRVIYGNGLEETVLRRAEADSRAGFVGLTANEEVNLLFVERSREHNRQARRMIALASMDEGVTQRMAHGAAASVVFGRGHYVSRWHTRFERGEARLERWVCTSKSKDQAEIDPAPGGDDRGLLLALVIKRGKSVNPVDDHVRYQKGDEVTFAVTSERAEEAHQLLEGCGWRVDGGGEA